MRRLSQRTFFWGSKVEVGQTTTGTPRVYLEHDSIFANTGLGIDLNGQAPANCASGPATGHPNDYAPCPIITGATFSQISGTACPGCTVEVFIADSPFDPSRHGEGKTYLGSTTAGTSNGAFPIWL